jgi:hemerythrin-like domain-containing protein
MKATEILSAEHRVIEQVLDCLEVMVQRAETSQTLEKQSILDAVAFFRAFADQCHHGKEEGHLFPAMEANGYPRVGGPTGVMLHEHELGRKCVRGMESAVEEGNVTGFVENARAFLPLLRQHIQKEDHCLFSMADQVFTAADQDRLSAAFERVAQEEQSARTHEQYLQLANQLADAYGVPSRTERARPHDCVHC